MKLSDQIPECEKLPPQDWWIVMERPVGSHIWTVAPGILRDSPAKADAACKKLVQEKGHCAIVVKVPAMPNIYDTDEEPVGKLSNGEYFHPDL